MGARIVGMIGVALLGFLPAGAIASNGNIQFNLNLTHVCSIVVTQGGTLDPRSSFRRLTSRSGPGIPGRADVTASGAGFTLSVDAPAAFDIKPPGDTTPNRFRAWHRSNGATSYGLTRNSEPINAGLNRVRIHMDARKFNGTGDVFEAGNYQATVVLRCE